MTKDQILSKYNIGTNESFLLDNFVSYIKEYNTHTNIVGTSTLEDPWNSHILDSLQIMPLIKERQLSIVDMGSGAGLPGLVLSIMDFKNVTLVDSNGKKITFLEIFKNKHNLDYITLYNRLEKIKNLKFDIVISRALAKLEKLFTYSQNFIKENTVLIFLKGKTVNEEIKIAKKKWNFKFEKKQSVSDPRGSILIIKELKKND